MTDVQNDRPVESEPTPAPPSAELVPLKPDRGALVLTMGVLGIVSAPIGFACCAPLGTVSVALGIIAWVMGSRDLKEMQSGLMDLGGQGITQAGQVCGIIATIIGGLVLLMGLLMLAVWVVMIIAAVAETGALDISIP